MDFLNKLYDSNYFGIGLFAVISFLVVTFLIVLFFGKKDEQKRKAEGFKSSASFGNSPNAFQETSMPTSVEVPVTPIPTPMASVQPVPPVAPINLEPTPVEPIQPVTPVSTPTFEPIAPMPSIQTPVSPVVPLQPVIEPINTNSTNNVFEPAPVINIPREPVAPIINTQVEPVSPTVNVTPNIEQPRIEPTLSQVQTPIQVEPVRFETPKPTVNPVVMEPTRVNISQTPVQPVVQPVIQESVAPVTPQVEVKPIIEEPVVNSTYYQPTPKLENENVSVPNIDFNAIAKSISKELDELEKSSVNNYTDVKVTPINEVTNNQPVQQTSPSQFSSVYVSEPVKTATVEMPSKIDLPTKKSE